ncbi:MAG: hypothetical protein E6Q97_03205 [Desulfurellales bacterium]|nr:MAG: hypothetical protein E6Q97_03205 [Desulfurellales bacterium]
MGAPQFLACPEAQAVPLAIPEGSERWEASLKFGPTDTETIRMPLNLRAPARLLFVRPTIVVVGQPFLNTNDLADNFWTKIDVDDRTFITTSNAGVSTNSPTNGNEVTFSSYRDCLLNIWASSPTPQLGFVFRSKHPAGAFGANTELIISATVIGYYVDNEGRPLPRKVAA